MLMCAGGAAAHVHAVDHLPAQAVTEAVAALAAAAEAVLGVEGNYYMQMCAFFSPSNVV